ncbi:MAG TPA: hypothetical protein VGC75_04075 [Candidatus Nitrosocosmicus sp.]|jgi:hypothetical protein
MSDVNTMMILYKFLMQKSYKVKIISNRRLTDSRLKRLYGVIILDQYTNFLDDYWLRKLIKGNKAIILIIDNSLLSPLAKSDTFEIINKPVDLKELNYKIQILLSSLTH